MLVLQNQEGAIVANDVALTVRQEAAARWSSPVRYPRQDRSVKNNRHSLTEDQKAGLLLPVNNGFKAFVFSRICAYIGDEQSLEQSLSRFLSHMTNVVDIVNASAGILVLLDEGGAGTDPKEGAALARP